MTLIFCYFIPMLISCAIYISLICNKKKKFKNKIAVSIDKKTLPFEMEPFEMIGIVEINNESVKSQIKSKEKALSVKSSISSLYSDAMQRIEDKDKISETSIKLIDKLHQTKDDVIGAGLKPLENPQVKEFQFGNNTNCWPSFVNDSYCENMQVTETADFSLTSNDSKADTNQVKCVDKETRSDSNYEIAEKRKRDSKMKAQCCVAFKSISSEGGNNERSCVISLTGVNQSHSKKQHLQHDTLSSAVTITQREKKARASSEFIHQKDERKAEIDEKVKRENENSIEKADAELEGRSMFECSNNFEVS